jgi:hypothetical protein
MKWPKSVGAHVVMAVLAAFCTSVAVYGYISNTHFDEYARQYPHDGQIGLAAFIDGLKFGAFAFVLGFGLVLLILRLLLGD